MQLKRIMRSKHTRVRCALQGPPHSGKTMSALLLAYGITGNWSSIALIDTEDNSGFMYSSLGAFHTVQFGTPFLSERYIDAIHLCEKAGMEVIIIDSLSPEWIGEYGIVHQYSQVQGSKWDRWVEVMPSHFMLLSTIRTSPCHIISTVRTAGEKVYQERGYAYNYHTVLSLDNEHSYTVIKDKTGVFSNIGVPITSSHGADLCRWSKEGEPALSEELKQRLQACTTERELNAVCSEFDLEDLSILQAVVRQRHIIEDKMQQAPSTSSHSKVVPISTSTTA